MLPAHPVNFPDPRTALEEPEGLLAAGGDLSPAWLIEAYALGIFPWFERDDAVGGRADRVVAAISRRHFRIASDGEFEQRTQQCCNNIGMNARR